ncbi:MAG: hypothetical protein ACK5MP_00215 [Nostocoides sp.]
MDDPVPSQVAVELRRVLQRWQQLPLEDALVRMPLVRAEVTELAGQDVPDLGPAVILDQLSVVVFDAAAAGAEPEELHDRLVRLRRALA